MEIITLSKYCDTWRTAKIIPAKEKLKSYMDERIAQIKIAMAKSYDPAQVEKALKEEKFLSAISDLETVNSQFMTSIETLINQALASYVDGINNGVKLREENTFLKERLEVMDKREFDYIELLKAKR
ncbi:MAG TPA: hypothetical protein VMW10_00445 [Alphaproteobacteria bacterium]|nr:hypothetical protein [Alphaproteobacteria bacterium]